MLVSIREQCAAPWAVGLLQSWRCSVLSARGICMGLFMLFWSYLLFCICVLFLEDNQVLGCPSWTLLLTPVQKTTLEKGLTAVRGGSSPIPYSLGSADANSYLASTETCKLLLLSLLQGAKEDVLTQKLRKRPSNNYTVQSLGSLAL